MPITFSGVTLTYLHYQKPALTDLTFEVKEGTITALLGQVGAGKTSLMRLINGLIPHHIPGYVTGTVKVDGIDVDQSSVPEMAQKVTMVFDDPALQIVSLTVEDDIAFGPANLALPRAEILERVQEALVMMRLSGYERRNPRRLSGGEQQLLAMAGVIAMRPKYLLLDEPVAMLDPLGKTQVLQAVRELHEQYGLTIIISESGTDIEDVVTFADEAIVLDKGQIRLMGDPRKVLADRNTIHSLGLRMPQVTEVAYALANGKKTTVPLTLDEGEKMVRDKLGKLIKAAHPRIKAGATSDQKAIVVHNLWHTFEGPPQVDALRGIHLEIASGEMVAILGQNGVGKTTLAYHLVGALKPTNPDARIEVGGLDVIKAPQFDVIQRVNYVFQNPANQLFCETFAAEVSYGPQRLGLPPEEVEKQARAALEQVGLGHLWQHSTFDIPRSLEVLLSIASVLALHPDVLIVDEPTGGLDLETGRRVMQILQQLNQQGHTILFITHDMALVAHYAQRVIVMKEGGVLLDGSPREVFRQEQLLAQAMIKPPQITQLSRRLDNLGFPPDVLTVSEFLGCISPEVAKEARDGSI
jgi:energy-coupling factor transport system ATP-binding protein